jgi:hypothetical protein
MTQVFHHARLCMAAYEFFVAQRLIKETVKKRRPSQPACLTRALRFARPLSAHSDTGLIRSLRCAGASLSVSVHNPSSVAMMLR